MGQPLSDISMTAFADSLEKHADVAGKAGQFLLNKMRRPKDLASMGLKALGRGLGGPFRGTEEAASRLLHPIQGIQKGWASMGAGAELLEKAKEKGFTSLQEMATKDPEAARKMLRSGTHHLEPSTSLRTLVREQAPLGQKTTAVANELSRQGWTGAGTGRLGGITKYLPVGSKGQAVGMAAAAVPNIINAEKATPTGQDGAIERGLGELGSNMGFIGGAGLGMAPMMGLWYAGMRGGSGIGRVADRMRAGASFGDAFSAPSKVEAEKQIENINRYHGDIT